MCCIGDSLQGKNNVLKYKQKSSSTEGNNHYILFTPSQTSQSHRYVLYVLEGCSDKEKAFDNWMQRDILFAQQIQAECIASGIPCKVNDGSESVGQIYEWAIMKISIWVSTMTMC